METGHSPEISAVMDIVRSGRASTRGEIVDLLKLRSTSVSEFVGDLVGKDLLRESIRKKRGRGRPAALLTYNWQRFGAVLLQVENRSLVAKGVDMAGRVVSRFQSSPVPSTDNAAMSAVLRDLAGKALAHFPAGVEVVGVVCSLSGLLDAPRRLWCFSSRWPALRNLDVGEALAPIGKDVVLIRNLDAELAGRLSQMEEAWRGESVLLLHWGYGIGASYYTDGSIVNRARGRFCEIGHWSLGNARGATCTCGNTDCLETVAAMWSLSPRLRSAFPDVALDEDAFGPLARQLDLLCVPELALAAREVVRLTGNLSRLLFPQRLVLTGPFVQNPDIFRLFVDALAAAPVLGGLDRTNVTRGEPDARYETSGALSDIFEAACSKLLGETP